MNGGESKDLVWMHVSALLYNLRLTIPQSVSSIHIPISSGVTEPGALVKTLPCPDTLLD